MLDSKLEEPAEPQDGSFAEYGRRSCSRPMARRAPLEVEVHRTDGSIFLHIQPDPREAAFLIRSMHPRNAFQAPYFSFSASPSRALIPSSAVEQISLRGETLPTDWPLPYGIEEMIEFPPGEPDLDAECDPRVADIETIAEFEMRSGRSIYVGIATSGGCGSYGRQMPGDIDFPQLLGRSVLFGRRSEGGLFVLNPSNVLRCTLHPVVAAVGRRHPGKYGKKLSF